MSDHDLRAELDRLQKENDKLKEEKKIGSQSILSFSVEDGGIQIHGLRRGPPIAFLKHQLEMLLKQGDEIKTFIADNIDALEIWRPNGKGGWSKVE